MSLNLSREHFSGLVKILENLPSFKTATKRLLFIEQVFYGEKRGNQIISRLSLDGSPNEAALELILFLSKFGQNEVGQESLGLLIKAMQTYVGEGKEGEFLKMMFDSYPLKVSPTAIKEISDWYSIDQYENVEEKIIGENTLQSVHLLQLALKAAAAVVKIQGVETGSGFLIGSDLVMTNHHIISNREQACQAKVIFNYERDIDNKLKETTCCSVVEDGHFYANPRIGGLDFTIFQIEPSPKLKNVSPLTLHSTLVDKDDRVSIIQHPGGRLKEFSMQNNFVAYSDEKTIQYYTTTEPGSSGSPVFNQNFEVVAIHHSGGNIIEPGSNRRFLRNEGSSMKAILKDIQNNYNSVFGILKLKRS